MSKIGVQQAYALGRETYLNGQDFESLDFKAMTDIEFEMAEKGYKDAGVSTAIDDLVYDQDPEELFFE